MFKIETYTWLDDREEIVIINQNKQIYVSILPSLGGILNGYKIHDVEVIDGISLDQNGIDDYLSAYKSAFLTPFPNRIAGGKFEYNSQNHQLECNEKSLGNALHGFVYDKPFTVSSKLITNSSASVELSYDYDGKTDGFPYPFQLVLRYKVESSGWLICTCIITNSGENVMPFGSGWHHYFSLNQPIDDLELSFHPAEHWQMNDKMIPTGQKTSIGPVEGRIGGNTYDDCFTLEEQFVRLKDGEDNQLLLDLGKDFPFLQIYTPPHRKSIAIEPMTCPPDVFNNREKLIEILPGQNGVFEFSMLIE
ncbi:MAG: hypothetical protein KDC85_20620 [Saprospiraceae bacterium]|nr:hypothetical protein [Saprospiraceae bacterium]MCB9322582.1 hypothetical protein [Lewinellaceae bacterium]